MPRRALPLPPNERRLLSCTTAYNLGPYTFPMRGCLFSSHTAASAPGALHQPGHTPEGSAEPPLAVAPSPLRPSPVTDGQYISASPPSGTHEGEAAVLKGQPTPFLQSTQSNTTCSASFIFPLVPLPICHQHATDQCAILPSEESSDNFGSLLQHTTLQLSCNPSSIHSANSVSPSDPAFLPLLSATMPPKSQRPLNLAEKANRHPKNMKKYLCQLPTKGSLGLLSLKLRKPAGLR